MANGTSNLFNAGPSDVTRSLQATAQLEEQARQFNIQQQSMKDRQAEVNELQRELNEDRQAHELELDRINQDQAIELATLTNDFLSFREKEGAEIQAQLEAMRNKRDLANKRADEIYQLNSTSKFVQKRMEKGATKRELADGISKLVSNVTSDASLIEAINASTGGSSKSTIDSWIKADGTIFDLVMHSERVEPTSPVFSPFGLLDTKGGKIYTNAKSPEQMFTELFDNETRGMNSLVENPNNLKFGRLAELLIKKNKGKTLTGEEETEFNDLKTAEDGMVVTLFYKLVKSFNDKLTNDAYDKSNFMEVKKSLDLPDSELDINSFYDGFRSLQKLGLELENASEIEFKGSMLQNGNQIKSELGGILAGAVNPELKQGATRDEIREIVLDKIAEVEGTLPKNIIEKFREIAIRELEPIIVLLEKKNDPVLSDEGLMSLAKEIMDEREMAEQMAGEFYDEELDEIFE